MPQPREDPVGRRDNRRADRDSERVGGEVGEAEIPVRDEVLNDLDARAVEGHPAIRKRLEEKLREHVEAASSLPPAEAVSPEEVPDGVREALRELGYVE